MYLQENTPEAQEMRDNITRLLTSEYEPNIALAFSLVRSGGFDFSFFMPMWLGYHRFASATNSLKEDFEAIAETYFSGDLQAYLLKEIEELHYDKYKPFDKVIFFEMLVQSGVATVGELSRLWEEESAYKERTALTRFLLEKKANIDKSFFLDKSLRLDQLQIKGIGFLFEDEDENFDKVAFLKRFVRGNKLDLNNTGLTALPTEALQLQGIEALDLRGTQIRDLPTEILRTVKDIKCNQKTARKLYGKVFKEGVFDYPYAQKLAYHKATMLWESKQYQKAFDFFQIAENVAYSPVFSQDEQHIFLRNYFDSALKVGKFEEGLALLKREKTNGKTNIFFSKFKEEFIMECLCADKEAELLEVLKAYHTNNAYSLEHFVGLDDWFLWRVMNEKLAYQNRFEESFKLFEKAQKYCAELYTHTWTWTKIFRHLRDHHQYEDIIKVFEHFETTVFYVNNAPKQPIERHNRCVWIWAEAYIAVGKLDKAEALCAYYIQYHHEKVPLKDVAHDYSYYRTLYLLKFAYIYLAEIYTKKNRQVCVDFYRQEIERIAQEIEEFQARWRVNVTLR
jgi:Leucine-rich repeat (LRR) protein